MNEEFISPCHCDPACKAQVPGGHVEKSAHAWTEKDDGDLICQLSPDAETILLDDEIKMPSYVRQTAG